MLLNNLVASNSARGSFDWNSEHSPRNVTDKTDRNRLLSAASNQSSFDDASLLHERNTENETTFLQNHYGKSQSENLLAVPPSYHHAHQMQNVTSKRDIRYTPHFPTPLYHLKKRTKQLYTDAPLVDELNLFQVALELFNRESVRTAKKDSNDDCQVQEMCQYFFQSVGKARVTPRLCTECRDVLKDRFRYDYYYVDLVEISQERTVMCSDCMYQLLKKNIYGTESELRTRLRTLRDQQPNGVLVDPFLISCGY